MKINAYAKINLALDVLGRRQDGYHEVRMIMQTVGLHDELEIERIPEDSIVITTDRDDLPVGGDNLIYKAARLLMDECGLTGGIKVHLTKNIPVAAGLAGGSTDAAATLIAVNELFGLGLSKEDLMKRAVRIGADVPYCIMGKTALSEGIGEILTPLKPCPGCRILLAKPKIGLSTAFVYKRLKLEEAEHPNTDAVIRGIENGDIKAVADNLGNILESVSLVERPVIAKIKRIMAEHGGKPLMSGSGPTVFGMFDSDESINKAYEALSVSKLTPELFITEIYN